MNDLRIGAIGLGLRRSLAATAHREPGQGSRVTALCDLDRTVLQKEAAHFGADVMETDYRKLLDRDDIDAVLVSTPDHTHTPIAIDALHAGKAVYLEKPMATTTEDADLILRAAYETGSRLYVGHNMRHMGLVSLMRKLVARGEIGQPRSVWIRHFVGHGGDFFFKDWHAERGFVNSLLLQKASHDIDALHWIVGGYTEAVQAMGGLTVYGDLPRRSGNQPKAENWLSREYWPPAAQLGLNPVIDVEDLSLLNLRLDNGVFAAYQQCHYSPDYWRSFTVIGDRGRLENFGDEPGGVIRLWNSGRRNYDADGDATHVIPEAVGGHGGADEMSVDEFVRFVRDGEVTETSPVAARMAVAAGDLATRSLRGHGATLAVPPLEPELLEYFDTGQVKK
ncbi:Gfo/Idh/MocA family oxidoreductase [Streptomyces sp. LHD-70]|uniref:Gfo/Idh/MocA family protein n=1 Tax=Streptomyces sp. LHD-70 TaxID=3072140 RepID=UPI00280FA2A6|nr:Gfo/Idh/MocA family oxidoreductase [Streptomyces sp. LHD-70]MDQ8707936.1 Gfo/Idh/MocA family oxidoreductase [Streptomyces sp. LHD-70]